MHRMQILFLLRPLNSRWQRSSRSQQRMWSRSESVQPESHRTETKFLEMWVLASLHIDATIPWRKKILKEKDQDVFFFDEQDNRIKQTNKQTHHARCFFHALNKNDRHVVISLLKCNLQRHPSMPIQPIQRCLAVDQQRRDCRKSSNYCTVHWTAPEVISGSLQVNPVVQQERKQLHWLNKRNRKKRRTPVSVIMMCLHPYDCRGKKGPTTMFLVVNVLRNSSTELACPRPVQVLNGILNVFIPFMLLLFLLGENGNVL